MDPAEVHRATRLAVSFNVIFLVVAILLVPFNLFGSEWIFTRAGFTGWCVVSFIWVLCSMVICVIWPVVESWGTIARIGSGVLKDLGPGGKAAKGAEEARESLGEDSTV
jgi:urea-proton symporter